MKYIKIERDEFKLEFENKENFQILKYCCKINKKELDNFPDEKLGDLEISKELENIFKDDLLLSYDFNSLYPSAQIDFNSTWPKKGTAYPFKKHMSDAVCSLFNTKNGVN